MKRSMRRLTIFLLVLAMLFAGATPAFAAKGHGKGPGKGHDKNHQYFELEVKGKGNFGNGGKITFILEFEDVNREAAWARKHIASLAAKKVFEGYTDGTFQPNKSVSRIEAIAAVVRLLGLKEEAEDPSKKREAIWFDDEKQIRKNHDWAVGYVVVAQEAGLFDPNAGKLQPNKAADRLWVTELLIRALDLEDEAYANRNAELNFKDSRAIPKDKVGVVKVAVDRGIITGYSDRTFRPNQAVKRAELAAMLERAEALFEDEEDDTDASGVIEEINNLTLVLRKNGQLQAYALDPQTFVFREGEKATIYDLKVGDTVFVRTYNNLVIFIEVVKPAKDEVKPFTATGYFHSLAFNENGRIASITITETLNSSRQVKYDVAEDVVIEGNVNELKQGRLIHLSGENKVVKKITIGDFGFQLQGELEYLLLNSNGQLATIAIRHEVNGKDQVSIYSVSPDVRITGNLNAIVEGQKITVYGTQQVVTEIKIG